MILDFEPLLSGEKKSLSFDYELDGIGDEVGVIQNGKAHISGTVTDQAGYISLKMSARLPYLTDCARCAKELSRELDIEYSCGVSPDKLSEENLDYEELTDGKLDIDELAVRCFILELPMTELCSEDCLGLCPECGKDLNEGPCDCKKPVDPRLQKIIDAINGK